MTPSNIFLMSIPRILKIAIWVSGVESLFSKVTFKIFACFSSVQNSITCIGMFADFQSTGMLLGTNSYHNFLKEFWEFYKISRKSSAMEYFLVNFRFTNHKLPSALGVLKNLQNSWDTSAVKYLCTEPGTNRFSTE